VENLWWGFLLHFPVFSTDFMSIGLLPCVQWSNRGPLLGLPQSWYRRPNSQTNPSNMGGTYD